MAIILGSKLVGDLDENKNVGIGVTLPLSRGNTGYFAQSFTSTEQVKSNLKNLLLTNRKERLMHPNFGVGLRELLFSQNTKDLETRIENEIETSVKYWLPFISIQDMVIEQKPENIDANIFSVSLTFSIAGQPTYETIEFNVTQ
jgi:uncharacterized protein